METAFAAMVLLLREGLEGGLIVALLLSALERLGARERFREVYLGVGLGLGLAAAGGLLAYLFIRSYEGSHTQIIFETTTYFLASGVMVYMTFWMKAESRQLKKGLESRARQALSGGSGFTLGFLAFQAVGREGLETVAFGLALAFSGSLIPLAIGATAGLTTALALTYPVYRFGLRIRLSLFFSLLGSLLLFFGAGLLVNAVGNLQLLGWLGGAADPVWNLSGFLSQESLLGDLLHGFLGYNDRPSLLQLAAYLTYLLPGLWLYLRPPRYRQNSLRAQL